PPFVCVSFLFLSFFLTNPATTDIYTLSLHDALPISPGARGGVRAPRSLRARPFQNSWRSRSPWEPETPETDSRFARSLRCSAPRDRKSTRLNSSHVSISYAVFCLKKKKKTKKQHTKT